MDIYVSVIVKLMRSVILLMYECRPMYYYTIRCKQQ